MVTGTKAVAATVVLAAVTFGLAACGGSSGVTTQSGPPSSPASTGPSPSSGSRAPTSPTPSPSFTPPNYGAAQPAVTAYLNLIAQYDQAFRNPAHSSAAAFDQYVVGNAKTLFDGSLFDEKKAGRYYKGTPAQQRVRVSSATLNTRPASVTLRSCPLESSSDPWMEYDAAGKVVPAKLAKGVAPPYGKTIKVIKLAGQWQVSEFATDATKTCTP